MQAPGEGVKSSGHDRQRDRRAHTAARLATTLRLSYIFTP